MASSFVLRVGLLRNLTKIKPHVTVVQARSYSKRRKKTYIQPEEEAEAYILFRHKLKEKRHVFLEEWQEKQRMKMEDFNTQAAEKARIQRELEERALEANRKELERMAKVREEALLQAEMEQEKKREEGERKRLEYESKITEKRKDEFLKVQEESHEFITMENLDEKIQEAIDNEINYNFALSHTGEKIV